MYRVVKCPICGKVKRTKGKKYFLCCQQTALDIKQCLVEEIEGKIWRRVEDSEKVLIIRE